MASSTVVRTSDESAGNSNKRRRVMGECIPDQALSTTPVATATATGTPRGPTSVETNASNTQGGSCQNNDVIVYPEEFPKLLLETLQSENGETVANGFATLASKIKDITSAQELKEFFMLGGPSIVSLRMRKSWPDESINQTIQTMGCCCIARMIGRSENLGLLLIRENGEQQLLQAYTTQDLDVQICSSSLATCRLLRMMELVVKALKDYPESKDLQTFGSAALINLLLVPSDGNNNDGYQDAKRLVEELGVVQIIVHAMTRFPTEQPIQSLGIAFLQKLCRLGMGKAPVLKTEALVVVAQSVQNFPGNQAMTKNALSFLNTVLGTP